MMQIIRWKGLISFAAILISLLLIVQFFADSWIKWGLERGLSSAMQVEVNVGQVQHQFSPLGLTLNEIQITDANDPQYNLYQIAQFTFDIQFAPLLMNKIIIDTMQVTGVKFNQLRQSPGEVYNALPSSEGEEAASDSALAKLTVEDLLAASPLQSTAAANELQRAFKQHDSNLRESYDNLPNKEQLKALQQRIKDLKETDYKDPAALLQAKQEFDDIKQQLKTKQQSLKDFKQALLLAKSDISDKTADLKQASKNDYDMLKGSIAGDAGALSDVTQAIFGGQAKKWSQWLFTGIEKIAPLLAKQQQAQQSQERTQGRWIEFSDNSQLPSFIIHRAEVEVQWQQQSINSLWRDITAEHYLIGRPTTFKLDAKASNLWQKMQLNGEFELDLQQQLKAKQSWELLGLQLSDLTLTNKNSLQSQLKSGALSSAGDIKVNNNQLQAQSNINLSALTIEASGESKLASAIAKSLNALSSLKLKAKLSGDIRHPDLSLSSDLDQQMLNIVSANLSPETQQKLAKLQQALGEKSATGISQSNEQQWGNWESSTNNQLTDIEGMLKEKLDNALDKKKEKLKSKLLNKLLKGD